MRRSAVSPGAQTHTRLLRQLRHVLGLQHRGPRVSTPIGVPGPFALEPFRTTSSNGDVARNLGPGQTRPRLFAPMEDGAPKVDPAG